jgi:uncharacterized protein
MTLQQDRTPITPAAIAAMGERLETFAATLSEHERAAMQALLARAAEATPLAQLAAQPVEAILTEHEAALLARLEAAPVPAQSGPRRALTMVMKATRLCNLRCTYCHYWKDGPNQTMTFPVLARAIRDSVSDPGVRLVEFVWHGGEPTLLPLDFYLKALWLQERFRRPDQKVYNVIQTNATRLSDEWLTFLRDYRFDVGVSLDGPPEVHDAHRLDIGGRPTAARVREGLQRLQESGVRNIGVLMVVDDEMCDLGAGPVLDYLLAIGVRHVGLNNARPANTPIAAGDPDHLGMSRYIAFLRELFHAWYPAYVDQITFRELADLAGQLRGGNGDTCFFAGSCHGSYLTVEPTGQVAACDKFIDAGEFLFGNLLQHSLPEILRSERLIAVQTANTVALRRQNECPWFKVCRGACPHDRYTAERLSPGFEATCCGYAPLLEDMQATLAAERDRGRGAEPRSEGVGEPHGFPN